MEQTFTEMIMVQDWLKSRLTSDGRDEDVALYTPEQKRQILMTICAREVCHLHEARGIHFDQDYFMEIEEVVCGLDHRDEYPDHRQVIPGHESVEQEYEARLLELETQTIVDAFRRGG